MIRLIMNRVVDNLKKKMNGIKFWMNPTTQICISDANDMIYWIFFDILLVAYM